MFKINKSEVVGQTNKLLYNIWQTLERQKEPVPAEQDQDSNLGELKRAELMALVKSLPDKPPEWSRLSNEQLKRLLKEGA